MNIKDAAGAWLALREKQVSRKTYEIGVLAVRSRIIPAVGGMEVEAVTRENCEIYLTGLYRDGLAKNTIRLYYLTLRLILAGQGREAPAREAWQNPKCHELRPAKEVRPLDENERGPYLRACEQVEGGDLLKVLLYSGLRKTEALNLTDKDLDFKEKVIKVRNSKSNAGRRSVPIAQAIHETLRNRPGRLFPITGGQAYRIHRRALELAGIEHRGRGLHCLRHTFAVMFLDAGGDLDALQKILGHSSITVTSGYLKFRAPRCHDVVDRILASEADARDA